MRIGPFLILFLAVVSEVIGTAALKASAGFTRLAPIGIVALGYGAALYFLALSLKQIPLGVAYAIWSGLGTVGAVILGALIWRESLGPARLVGIALVVAGVVVLNVFTRGEAG